MQEVKKLFDRYPESVESNCPSRWTLWRNGIKADDVLREERWKPGASRMLYSKVGEWTLAPSRTHF